MLPRQLRARRLVLRPFGPGDVDGVLAYATDEAWARYLPVPIPYQRSDAESFVAHATSVDWKQDAFWGLEYESRLVGALDLSVPSPHLGTLGYSIARTEWGRGLATEAVCAVLECVFASQPELVRIEATTHVDNVASMRVLEKAGFTREARLRQRGCLRGRLHDELIWARFRPEA